MKCVFVINQNLPKGLIANTASVLGLSIGNTYLCIIGEKIIDKSGSVHEGITSIPIPILSSTNEKIKEIRNKAIDDSLVRFVDFTNIAQKCKNYDDYIQKMLNASEDSIEYLGIGLWGNDKSVSRLTGNLPLLR